MCYATVQRHMHTIYSIATFKYMQNIPFGVGLEALFSHLWVYSEL